MREVLPLDLKEWDLSANMCFLGLRMKTQTSVRQINLNRHHLKIYIQTKLKDTEDGLLYTFKKMSIKGPKFLCDSG